ncbi:hypothetical protein SAMN04489713_12538 [Actinomadura madurae]|uniref:Uncharacterized protein n=1 Tax=Actinomadura madurae TaxID=1993 RepID=A0A1I5WZ63_9ACTN|nr:hypothetical protein SAMN04489713_12538 [Actinomadura madurae]
MTLARRGCRRIVVDGAEYRWKVRGRPTYCQGLGWSPLTFAVEAAESPGALLVVSLPCAHPSNWVSLPSGVVLPRTVSRAIHSALLNGWMPTRPGPTFTLTLSGEHPRRDRKGNAS